MTAAQRRARAFLQLLTGGGTRVPLNQGLKPAGMRGGPAGGKPMLDGFRHVDVESLHPTGRADLTPHPAQQPGVADQINAALAIDGPTGDAGRKLEPVGQDRRQRRQMYAKEHWGIDNFDVRDATPEQLDELRGGSGLGQGLLLPTHPMLAAMRRRRGGHRTLNV